MSVIGLKRLKKVSELNWEYYPNCYIICLRKINKIIDSFNKTSRKHFINDIVDNFVFLVGHGTV